MALGLADLARLEALAQAASQGEWHLDEPFRGWIFCDGSYIATTHRGKEALVVPNAAYIAALSPKVVLELIARAQERWGTWAVVDKCDS